MNFVDLFALLGMGFGFVKGRKRGLDVELYRLINMAVVFLAGCSLYKLIGKVLSVIPGLDADGSGFIGFIVAGVAAFLVMRKLRVGLKVFLASRFGGSAHRNLAGAVGLARWGVGMAAAVAALLLSRASVLTGPLAEGSLLGRTLGAFLSGGQ